MKTDKRIGLQSLKDHVVIRSKVTEEESTEEETAGESSSLIEWEINQMRFIQKMSRQVVASNFLSPFILMSFKFYINKMVLVMINKEIIKNYRKDKDGHPKLLKLLAEMENDVISKMGKLIVQIKECKEKEAISHFEDGFSSKYQEFTKIKMGYRNTIGRVYE